LRNSEQVLISLCVIICALTLAVRCQATEYRLGPLILSEPLPNELGQNHKCVPRTEFFNTLQCSLKNSATSRAANISDVLVDASNGKLLFAFDKSYRSGGLAGIERSVLSETSDTLGGLAPKRFSVDNAVVAVWGEVKFEKISEDTDEYVEIKGRVEQQYGLLVDMMGDFKASKDASRPVYRVIGGDGLVVVLSENTPRHVVVQRFIVAAGTLSENNFKSQARQFLLRDQDTLADDYSRWPEIAFMIRRLALNTTTENANKVVDEVFGSASSRKYYSHIWAFLPTSVIKHLRDGTYMSFDVFGDKTEFPGIRDQIIAQLRASPREPFSEFLLYTLGRFDEAVHFNQHSPIHTVLTYAFAHSNLRQVLSTLFKRAAKPGDMKMLEISAKSYLEEIDPENIQFQSAGSILLYNNAKKVEEHNRELDDEQLKRKSENEINTQLAKKDFLNGHAEEHIETSKDPYRDNAPSLTQYANYFNEFPERYDSRPMARKFPDFILLTDSLLPQFEEVLKDQKSPHFDDAAYFLGWLEYHRGNVIEALNKFELAIALLPKVGSEPTADNDNLDYDDPALHQTSRILRLMSPEEALSLVKNSKILSSQPKLWYTVLDSLYHLHRHQLVIDGARRALREFGVTVENLPVTTDPTRITSAFTKLKLAGYPELEEIVYLYNASREADQLEAMLSNIEKVSPQAVAVAIKTIVTKYSLIRDSDLDNSSPRRGLKPQHKDLRQSIYLAQLSLDRLPKTPEFSQLRKWLHYKRITLLAQFSPLKVGAANAELEKEFPNSILLNDGMAEQVFAEAVVMGDMIKATATFNALRHKFPTGNAVDNAYSWMAIGWTCAGQPVKARKLNEEIIRLFPLTRHARYAHERLREPHACSDLQELYDWDYQAVSWRERNRIDLIQHALELHQL
jgi:tetratricopeptide (TPR) repeat protein